MSDHSSESQTASPEATRDDAIDQSRRKLTGAALGVSAIITLASRPVLAQECLTPSAAASGNLSHHGDLPPCQGLSVDAWKVIAPEDLPGGDPKFNDVFKKNSNKANWNNDTLSVVLDSTDETTQKPNPISREFAATLLNIRSNPPLIPPAVLNEVGLIGMWNEWVDTNAFVPKAGASWNGTQIVTYLRGLQA
jgi:hypothetical protein